MFGSKDCFTGESPGIGHEASHLHTGGSRMCAGEGQVQVGLLRTGMGGGLVTSARISLMELVTANLVVTNISLIWMISLDLFL